MVMQGRQDGWGEVYENRSSAREYGRDTRLFQAAGGYQVNGVVDSIGILEDGKCAKTVAEKNTGFDSRK